MKIHNLGFGSEALDNLEDVCIAIDCATFDVEAVPDHEFLIATFLASFRYGKFVADRPLIQIGVNDVCFNF